jgi:hypothetical protein
MDYANASNLSEGRKALRALLEPLGQQEDELFIREPFESADRNIEGNFTTIVALERDADLRRPHPAVGKASRPRGFEGAPVNSGPIGETTHWGKTLRVELSVHICKGLTARAVGRGRRSVPPAQPGLAPWCQS